MLSTNNSMTQTHALYMEHKAIATAIEVGRYEIKNGNTGNRPHTPDPLKADCEELFYTLDVLLSTLGQPVFETLSINAELEPVINTNNQVTTNTDIPIPPTKPVPPLFYYKVKDGDAQGYYDDDGFVVLAGSLIRQKQTPHLPLMIAKLRERLLDDGKLIAINDKSYKLIENQLFKTPSGAGQMVSGRSSNGWTEWKNAAGETLDSVYR